ncbi:MAG: hypothetical protein M3245_02910 [Actinomycetota bacterium]|nr:hypothetical protein [Actinomycetota bacterium]
MSSRVVAAVLLSPAVVAAAGCGPATTYAITLEVRDGWVREPGTECAGSRPFLYVHADAPYRVVDARSGDVVASGALPAGTAVEALREDLGVSRVPSFCRFRLTVPLPGPGQYRLVLSEGDPLRFTAAAAPGEPILLTIP